eukprot:1184569-Prorocentrum_minimum.AAC.2
MLQVSWLSHRYCASFISEFESELTPIFPCLFSFGSVGVFQFLSARLECVSGLFPFVVRSCTRSFSPSTSGMWTHTCRARYECNHELMGLNYRLKGLKGWSVYEWKHELQGLK